MSETVEQKHDWFAKYGMICCRLCGFVQNAKNAHAQCRGVVRVALRDSEPVEPSVSRPSEGSP